MSHIPNQGDIPAALRARDQWVCWRLEAREGDDKLTKVPYQAARPNRKASSKAEHTWSSLALALQTAADPRHKFDGVGYVFSADDPYAGFDLDNIIDEQGTIADWAKMWLLDMATYAEISPSGRGVKGIAIGKLPGSGINAGSVELYDQGRYFTITGRRLDGHPAEPQPVNGALDRLYAFAQQQQALREATQEEKRQRAYAVAALTKELERVQSAPEGTRNSALNRAAFSLAQFIGTNLLSEDEIADALSRAAGANGLSIGEIRATLRSGIKAGSQETRKIPPPKDQDAVSGDLVSADEAPLARPVEQVAFPTPISAADLARKDIEPTRYFIPDMLRAGLALFVGNPGIGKTPALVQLALAFATGGKWLGAIQVMQCRVLYIGVEYDEAYLKEVLIDSYGSSDLPSTLFFLSVETFTPPKTEEESMELLRHYLVVMQIDVVIIDVFSGFLPREKFKMDKYRGDYAEFLAYQRLFMEYKALLVGSWHGGKHAKDPETAYNGGQGMWGSAGGGRLTMIFDEENQVRLRSQLRGHERKEWVLEQARIGSSHFWSVVDADPDPIFGSDAQRRIYSAVKRHSSMVEPLTPQGVKAILTADAPELGLKDPYIRQTLARLEERGILRKWNGGYVVTTRGSREIIGSDGSRGSLGSRGSGPQPDESPDPKDPTRSNGAIQAIPHSDAIEGGAIQAIHEIQRSNDLTSDPTVLVVDLTDLPAEDITDTMPDDWQASPADIVITFDAREKKYPWQVVVRPTGRRLAYERTQAEAVETARMQRGD